MNHPFFVWVLLFSFTSTLFGSSGGGGSLFVSGFIVGPVRQPAASTWTMPKLDAAARMGELTEPEQKVFDLLQALHKSKLPFRAVLVGGRGAILESTQLLGPELSLAQSPSTGENLLTLAATDKSFELHVQLSSVSKIVLVTKENKPEHKTLRIVRLLNTQGESMCSLILAATDDDAVAWFKGLVEEFGSEMQL